VPGVLVLPWHMTDSLADGLGIPMPDGATVVEGAPAVDPAQAQRAVAAILTAAGRSGIR
jgi:hypothetical protein